MSFETNENTIIKEAIKALWKENVMGNQSNQKLIEQIKAKAPAILSTMVSEMGYEFSAISSNGFIEQRVGMLLDTETGGYLPKFLNDEKITDEDRNQKLELFFEEYFDIIPYEELEEEQLRQLANLD